MTEPSVENPQASRREAESAALEAAIVAAVTAAIASRVAAVRDDLVKGFAWAATRPVLWAAARRRAARSLRSTRVDISLRVGRFLPRAAELGARQAAAAVGQAPRTVPARVSMVVRPVVQARPSTGQRVAQVQRTLVVAPRVRPSVRPARRQAPAIVRPSATPPSRQAPRPVRAPAAQVATPAVRRPTTEPTPPRPPRPTDRGTGRTVLPASYDPAADPLVTEILDSLDQVVTSRLEAAADAIETGPLDTRPQLDVVLARVDAVQATAAAGVGDVVARTIAGGTAAVAARAGVDLVWKSERGACHVCTSLNGAVAGPDGRFRPVRAFTARVKAEYGLPPSPHPHCRCVAIPNTPGMADALRRESEREIARGESRYDSLPARLAAVDRLLQEGAERIPKSVRDRAARDLRNRKFSGRDQRTA